MIRKCLCSILKSKTKWRNGNFTFLASFPKTQVTLISKRTSLSRTQTGKGSVYKNVLGRFSLGQETHAALIQLVKLPRRLKHHLGLLENWNLTLFPFIPGFNIRIRFWEDRKKKKEQTNGRTKLCPSGSEWNQSCHPHLCCLTTLVKRTLNSFPAGDRVYETGDSRMRVTVIVPP